MRLDGHLEDFTLPDVLQLLSQTVKTGSLLLETGDGPRQGVIRLGAGAIDGASSDVHSHALARRLVGAGLVADEALDQAAADLRAGGPSLVRALLDRAGLRMETVAAVAREQATDAVCELLRWTSGSFSFRVGEADPDGLGLALRTDELVAEGERRMQVWPSLTSQIPSPDTVMRLAAAPAVDPSCTREEWGLIALVDGRRSVSEIVALLGRSEFAVAGALAALVERGLLTGSAAGSGFADLQRRQSVIAELESGAPVPAAAATAAVPAARAAERAPASAPVSGPDYSAPVHGSMALDPVAQPEPAEHPALPAIRGLDSAVTKSLVLRLIAGVRSL